MIKVNFNPDNVEFFYNEEKGITIARLNGTKYMFTDFLRSTNEGLEPEDLELLVKWEAKLLMPDTFIGKAVCAPGDTYDPEIGHLIAYDRLRCKISDSFAKRMNTYCNMITEYANRVVDKYNSYMLKVEDNEQYRANMIYEVIGGENVDVSTTSD